MQQYSRPTLFTAADYPIDLVPVINAASERIRVVSTTFRADDPRSQAITDALRAAAKRGVDVSVAVDTFSYLEPKEFFLRSPRRQPARAFRALQIEHQLKHVGASFHWLGRRTNILATGRTHSKWVVVDDIVYSFGGVNIDNESFENTDYTIKYQSRELAELIVAEHEAIIAADRNGGGRLSHSEVLDEQTTILFDGGLPFDSIIYRRAATLAKQATSIILVSQYCPTGRLNRTLKRKGATVYFNHWRHASHLNRLLIRLGMFTAKQATSYTRDNYVHAKFIIYTMPDGSKTAIAGSHNFMYSSGLTGTREIAIETTNKHIIKQLEQYRKKYVE